MPFDFSAEDITRIGSVLEAEPHVDGHVTRFELLSADTGRRLVVEIRSRLELPESLADQPPNVVSVYAPASFLQLQGCTGFIASQDLGEVIFFARRGGFTSGLVVERDAACSQYAHVDERAIKADFTTLPPELIMSSVALSLTESLFDELG
jgi:hypothetical protein